VSNFCWVLASLVFNSERALSRTDTRSSLISEEAGSRRVETDERTEGESSAEEYTEWVESESKPDCGPQTPLR